MSWILGHQTTTFHHAEKSISLPLKGSTGASRSLPDLTKNIIPPCNLNPFLFNGHLQTGWTALSTVDIPITYKRKIFDSDNKRYPGTFSVDFVVPTLSPPPAVDETLPPRTTYWTDEDFKVLPSDDDKPMLIILHGLAGGSDEIYLRALLKPLCLDVQEAERWEACVINARGCAMSKITTGRLYTARSTWDIRQLARWAREMWPRRKLFACGFSLGGNILVNYLGEEGSKCPLDVATVISNPWNLDVANTNMQSTFLGTHVYSRAMGKSMKQLVMRHRDIIFKEVEGLDAEKIDNIKYLHEFDRYVQCPTWSYPTEGFYYRDASCLDPLLGIRTPLLALHAKDDPIVPDLAAPYQEVKQTPFAVMVATSGGGHLSWFEWGGERWFAKAASGWMRELAESVDFEALRDLKAEVDVTGGNGEGKTQWNPVQRRLYDGSPGAQASASKTYLL